MSDSELLSWRRHAEVGAARMLAALSMSLIVSMCWAQRATPADPVISDADMERARRAHPTPSDEDLRRVPLPSTPRLDALPQPAAPNTVDLGAIAGGYTAQTEAIAQAQGLRTAPTLLIFISFSMPAATLDRLAQQAARVGGTLVLRGLVNDKLRDTVVRTQPLIRPGGASTAARNLAVQIDPQAFDRYAVQQTPTFVLVQAGAAPSSCSRGACADQQGFVSVAGDVSLDYALRAMRSRAPAFEQLAKQLLGQLGGGGP